MSSAAEHEALATVLMTPVAPGLLAAAFLLDAHFMNAAERDRAWHPALFGNAIALSMLAGPLGIVCLPLHIARTRRGLRRVVLPPVALVAYFIVLIGAAFLVDGIAATLE
jgi:H+/Cl- antiporter ClcA